MHIMYGNVHHMNHTDYPANELNRTPIVGLE